MLKRSLAVSALGLICAMASPASAATLIDLDFDSAGVGTYSAVGSAVFGAGQNASDFPTGNALYFNGSSARTVTFNPVNLSSGGNISFDFRIGSYNVSSAYFEGEDSFGEDVVFDYSLDGTTFTQLEQISSAGTASGTRNVDGWASYSYNFAANSGATNVQLRFSQSANSGIGYDQWAVDNVLVTSMSAAVPEPATWAMMLLGFGSVAGALRSTKRRQKLAVRYA